MTGRTYPEDDFWDDISEHDPDGAEAESTLLHGLSNSFPGAQYFDKIMRKKKPGKKVGKFKISRSQEYEL